MSRTTKTFLDGFKKQVNNLSPVSASLWAIFRVLVLTKKRWKKKMNRASLKSNSIMRRKNRWYKVKISFELFFSHTQIEKEYIGPSVGIEYCSLFLILDLPSIASFLSRARHPEMDPKDSALFLLRLKSQERRLNKMKMWGEQREIFTDAVSTCSSPIIPLFYQSAQRNGANRSKEKKGF